MESNNLSDIESNNLSDGYRYLRPPLAAAADPMRCTRFRPRNRLLAMLPPQGLLKLWPHLHPVPLVQGNVLAAADEPLTRVYFVEAGIVSLVAVFENRATSEMAMVGREGIIGLCILLGGDAPFGRCVVQAPGLALALDAARFRSAVHAIPSLRAACEDYARAFLREALQTAACNSVHRVEERCARWLLMNYDRSDGKTLSVTQEYLAEMLGVCRSTVTVAARALQRAGLIRYRRGLIEVRDRTGLEAAACECYGVVRDHYRQSPSWIGDRSRLDSCERPPSYTFD